ncbi:MAG: ABC transporter permease subunit [Myxococcaceae bacterium]|nr:ABC transporter permease subunit [Myxococcaceae bacterium]
MRQLVTVLHKELLDGVRDRRVWLVVLVTALVSGPLTLLLVSKFLADLKSKAEAREVLVENAQAAPRLVNFLERQGRVVEPPPADVRALIEAGRFDDAVLVVPEGFEADLFRGRLVELSILHDTNRAKSTTAAVTLERLVGGFGQELTLQRLLVRSIDPALIRTVRPTLVALGSSRGGATRLLFLVPLVALVSAVIGALAIAIDVTAGERERGSLEPLLMNPVSPWSLVLGKWLAVCTASLVTLVGTVTSFAVAGQVIRDEGLSAAFQFGVAEAGYTLAVLGPFCLFVSSVLMLAALFARGHKEAQATTSYIVSLVSIAPSLSMFLSLQDASWQLLVPALGQNMVLARVFRGSPVTVLDVLTPALVCVGLTFVTLVAKTKLVGRESIVFAKG